MATANEIKDELQFNGELMDILDVMKNIAVFEFRALQRKRKKFDMFAQCLKGFFGMLDVRDFPHPFIRPATDRPAIVMITSDEGFMGGLNRKVISAGLNHPGADGAELVIVGERGAQHLKEIGRPFTVFSSLEERYRLTSELTAHVIKGIKNRQFGRVVASYPRPVSFMVQQVKVIEILPIAGETPSAPRNDGGSLIIESPMEGIIEYLAEGLVLQKLMEVLEDSKLSEFAARAIHLEESGQELAEKKKYLKFQYFRSHHEIIDKTTRELFAAQIIRRKG